MFIFIIRTLKEILQQLNIELEVKNGEIIIENNSNSSSENSKNKDVCNNKITAFDSTENVIRKLSIIYNNKFCENENKTKNLKNFTKIVTLENIKDDNTKINDIKNVNNSLIKIVTRIQQKVLSPGLLCAIYATVYKDGHNKNKELSNYYYNQSINYMYNNIHAADIQNIQIASLLSNLKPGTKESYLLNGISIRLLRVLNNYDDHEMNKSSLFNEERIFTLWYCINNDIMQSLLYYPLCQLNQLDQPLAQVLEDPYYLKKNPPEDFTLKYIVIFKLLTKVLKHASDRRKGNFNINEFKKLIERLEYLDIRLKKEYLLIQRDKKKSNSQFLLYHFYSFLIFYVTKLILFNIELSPFVYKNRLSPSKKYVQIREEEPHFDIKSLENITGENSDNGDDDFSINYQTNSILDNMPSYNFNYQIYNDFNKYDNNNDLKFLKIPPIVNGFDYETCYHICYDTVEKATEFLETVNKHFNKHDICYPYYLGWIFYNLGIFYMLIYTYFKKEPEIQEKIEFFHEQIKVMYINYPYISYYYSKLYEKAKREARKAAYDDSILFYPQGVFQYY
ncbi:hypothetical protein PIROE2DRAFT_8620 [Piromyces sp. E2]|nr:hypothetical protein PIROE2DRAFT_8620 [Piromyces sp. E2]|eukprot:OUM64548.1 hypothetical protein PIROE2DRAFT_8620 [Piromyces sp. E2]